MSLDKAIEHRKEHRRSYRGAKAFDCSCRNHGTCEWCLSNRLYKNKKRSDKMNEKLRKYKENELD